MNPDSAVAGLLATQPTPGACPLAGPVPLTYKLLRTKPKLEEPLGTEEQSHFGGTNFMQK